MRMWMCRTDILCRQHLLGEYREIFTFLGVLKKRYSIKGYIDNNCLEPESIVLRYNELKNELIKRGYHPVKEFKFENSLLDYLPKEIREYKINRIKSLIWLIVKCKECNRRFNRKPLNL